MAAFGSNYTGSRLDVVVQIGIIIYTFRNATRRILNSFLFKKIESI